MGADGQGGVPEGSPSIASVKQDSFITSNVDRAAADDVEGGVDLALFHHDVAPACVAHRHPAGEALKLLLGKMREGLDSCKKTAYLF